jgi:fructose-1,6-bisphosphatase/inositol monophosphatase family enzyme
MALMRHGATRFKAPRRSLQDMTQGMTCDVTEGARRLFQEVFDEAAGEIRSRVLRTAEDDRRLESWIADRIAREMPTARILGEEHTRREPKGEAEFTVLIDPIDGSMNYYRGLPDVGMALALIRGTRLRLDAVGVALVGNLLNGWRVSAVKGAGLRMPNVRMPSSSGKFIAFDFDGNFDAQLLGRLLKAYGFVRRLGSTTLELALVASGAIDAFVDVRGTLTAENFLAPSLLVREAGGALEVHGVHGVHGVQGIGPESELNLQSGYRVLATHRAGELARLAELVTS